MRTAPGLWYRAAVQLRFVVPERYCLVALSFALSAGCGSYRTGPAGPCGDGIIDLRESCDDGNTDPDDGCSARCQIEADYVCSTPAPSLCFLPCNVRPLVLDVAGTFPIELRPDCSRVRLEIWGAGGGGGGSEGERYGTQGPYVGGYGGGGAFASVVFGPEPDAVLTATVGEGGYPGRPGATCAGGGGGGGASSVSLGAQMILIAAGGGGGAGSRKKIGTTGGIRASHGTPGRGVGLGPASLGQDGGAGVAGDGFGGAGGLAQTVSGGAGGLSPGGGGGGGGYPGGVGGDGGVCSATEAEMVLGSGGEGGASLVAAEGFAVAGGGTQPGNAAEAEGAGAGGIAPDTRAAGAPGTDGRVVVTFLD